MFPMTFEMNENWPFVNFDDRHIAQYLQLLVDPRINIDVLIVDILKIPQVWDFDELYLSLLFWVL